MSSNIKTIYSNIKASDFPKTCKNNGKVIQINHDVNIKDAMKILCDNQIYSAPIYNTDKKEYTGMIDMADIVDFIAKNFERVQLLGKGFEAILNQADSFVSNNVETVANSSERKNFIPISGNASMLDVAKLLTEHFVHRVNVFDEKDENLINIITKSSIVEQIAKHQDQIGDIGNKTINELNVGSSPVVSIDIKSNTIEAFALLYKSNMYAVPVVNRQLGNAIVANISAKDVREVCSDPSRFSLLYAPISEFLSTKNNESIDIATPSITCSSDDTLNHVIKKLVVNKIHRLYVLNNSNAPAKVITLTDIMHVLVE